MGFVQDQTGSYTLAFVVTGRARAVQA